MIKPTDIAYLPTSPGCYLFKDASGIVLYVGKAKNIKKRVASYFNKRHLEAKTALLVTYIENIDVMVTQNELEALLLENNLIKKYYPKYNLDLKDSRRYAYLLLHAGPLPYLEVARDRSEPGEYYGPFVSGAMRRVVMDVVSRTFRILTKKPSPRLKKIIDPIEYAERVIHARRILKGDVDGLIADLTARMNQSSTKTNYEYALTLRNQIAALHILKEKQIMEMQSRNDIHIMNFKIVGDEVFLLIFSIRKGVLEEKQSFSFAYYEDFFEDFIMQYYDMTPIPHEVVVPVATSPALASYLATKAQRKVLLHVPQKGDKKDLLELVASNVNTTFFAGSENVRALQEILQMKKPPRNIECFDISHLGGTGTVASMVSFVDGLPNKANYRKFKIREVSGGDDFAAMREVIRRRYGGSLTRTLSRPDLIVMDGGSIQLQAALDSLAEIGQNIPVIALAKRFEEIYTDPSKQPLRIDHKNKGLQLLQSLRDEAHRFAVTYQRLLRSKEIKI
jgi:excinuclease ABC subunit C